jgi:hypothetical protein
MGSGRIMRMSPNTVLKSPSADDVARFERLQRVALPGLFRKFLTEHNGGVPVVREVRVGDRHCVVERFLAILDHPDGFGDAGWYDIEVTLSQLADRMLSPDLEFGADLVPFALLFGGDYLCLDYRGGPSLTIPGVVIWDHEESDTGEPVVHSGCDSFEEFLSLFDRLGA